MKAALLSFTLAVVVLIATDEVTGELGSKFTVRPPVLINRPTLPADYRAKREASPQNHGSISISRDQPLSGPERRPSYNIDYQHNIWQGQNGQISAGGGAQKSPGQRWQPHIGVQGTWRFKREANPQNHGSISISRDQPLSGPERRPSYKVDYQHNIWQGKNGQISAGGGAQKLPGQRWEPQIGVQGRWRF